MEILHILLVEDQKYPRENLVSALKLCGDGLLIDVAGWYTQTEAFVQSGCPYDVIFLDHRMPYDDPGCTDTEDFDRFCDQLRNIGYGLIPLICEYLPGAVIVGTSSLDPQELRGFKEPNFKMDKTNPWEEIPRVLKEIQCAKE